MVYHQYQRKVTIDNFDFLVAAVTRCSSGCTLANWAVHAAVNMCRIYTFTPTQRKRAISKCANHIYKLVFAAIVFFGLHLNP